MKNKEKRYFFNNLIKKIKVKEITIGVIGMGYVGLPRALSFAEKKIKVIGFDINEEVINTLNNGETHIKHINQERINIVSQSGYFSATSDFEKIKNIDVIIICVPTPLKENKDPDLGCIFATLDSIKNYLREGQTLILESTTFPGTTDEILKPFIEKVGLNIGFNFFLVYSPEREDPANNNFQYYEIPKLLGGITNKCTDVGKKIYELVNYEVIVLSSTKTAEMTKMLENIYRAINIGLVNEMKELSDFLNIDIYEVIKAAATKPFGFKPFYPGPGVGGHCIPIDPYYLTWKAKEFGIEMKLINSASEINSSMPSFVVKKLIKSLKALNKRIDNCKVLVLGISYKKNIDDYRESPSLNIINLLLLNKAKVFFNDPFIKESQKKLISEKLKIENIEITAENLRKFDCVLLLTDHDQYDYEKIQENSNLIIDTRGRLSKKINIIRA